MGRYTLGEEVRLTGTFRVGATLTDPGAVTLHLRDPEGTETSPTTTKSSTGTYYADVVVSTEGLYHYRFEGTAPALGAAEGKLEVRSDFG
jgi:hypothetical protein